MCFSILNLLLCIGLSLKQQSQKWTEREMSGELFVDNLCYNTVCRGWAWDEHANALAHFMTVSYQGVSGRSLSVCVQVHAYREWGGWVQGQAKEAFRWNKSITAAVERSAVNLYQTSGDHPVLQISEVLSRHALMALIYGVQDSLKRSIP